jgi:hypothetical protein
MPSSRLGMQLLCPARSQSRREFGELAYKTGNCGIICSGRAGNLDPVVFLSHRPAPVFYHIFRQIRHLLAISPQTYQTGILQSAISLSLSPPRIKLGVCHPWTSTGRPPKPYLLDILQATTWSAIGSCVGIRCISHVLPLEKVQPQLETGVWNPPAAQVNHDLTPRVCGIKRGLATP